METLANRLADATADAIPHHRIAKGARRGKAQARPGIGRFTKTEGREIATRKARALVVDFAKIFRSEDADAFRKSGGVTGKNSGVTFRN